MNVSIGETLPDISAGFDVRSEHEAGEPFHCLICLDLVYKPIVHACGHIFCFWCAHRAMNPKGNSQCALCRRFHVYFPRICEMLHYFLMKTLPEDYSRRAQETQNMENTRQIFSPRIPDSPSSPCWKQNDQDGWDRTTEEISSRPSQLLLNGVEKEHSRIATQDKAFPSSATTGSEHLLPFPSHGAGTNFQHASDHHLEEQTNAERLTSQDFACASCRRLVYRPVVLNCGRVFCESCIETLDSVQICPSCSDPHLGETVHVCLELHHHLERTCPAYGDSDRPVVLLSEKTTSEEAAANYESTERAMVEREEEYACKGDPYFVHVGAGCDGCGMFPIVGDRYACTECCESIGYDLCRMCMRKGIFMEGRFSQAHRPGHRFRRMVSEWRANLGHVDFRLNGSHIIQRRRSHQQQRLMFLELQF